MVRAQSAPHSNYIRKPPTIRVKKFTERVILISLRGSINFPLPHYFVGLKALKVNPNYSLNVRYIIREKIHCTGTVALINSDVLAGG